MKNNIFVIDIDGTLIKGQSQRYFIAFLKEKSIVSFLAYIRIMTWFILYKFHLAKNSNKILSFALEGFKGKSVASVNLTTDEFITQVVHPLYFKNSKTLISMLQSLGYQIILLSSAVEIIVQAIAKDLNVSDYICTKVKTENGLYTGEVEGVQVYGEQKRVYLEQYLSTKSLKLDQVTVIADHISDIPLLKSAKYALVANPDTKMYTWAQKNNIPMIYLDSDESIQYVESHIVS
ncbi:MAG: HAD-IB family hydrolase [Candidatus Pacebacteria bacterium]|nr:HAD-IB family hydrolase [Candidatus Paceibacterota bacterium]